MQRCFAGDGSSVFALACSLAMVASDCRLPRRWAWLGIRRVRGVLLTLASCGPPCAGPFAAVPLQTLAVGGYWGPGVVFFWNHFRGSEVNIGCAHAR